MSVALEIAKRLVVKYGREKAHEVFDQVWDALTTIEAAALTYDWDFWARPKQKAPKDWRTWGFLTGRGFGKTLAIAKHINDEVQAGRAMLICLLAQDEQSAIDIQVLGPSGLIATAPPWFKPHWEVTGQQLVWPNGARAYVRTPEVPGKIRGLEYHLTWASELQSWPVAQRDEAMSNVRLSTRLGYSRIVWDATPKRRHPILRELLEDGEANPRAHPVVRGTTHENAMHLGPGYVEELERKYGGTLKGKEELLGEMLAESERALVHQEWIDKARRDMPEAIKRRVIGIDPAVTARKGNDRTGIVEATLGVDGQAYVTGDYSGKHDPPSWARIVLDKYLSRLCDCVIVETNKGGDLVTQNLRAAAQDRGLRVTIIGLDDHPRHTSGIVYIKTVHARGPKEDRAQPVATAYERGRVSHVRGVDLSSLEDTLTSWEPSPGARSPDDLDALTHALTDLLKLMSDKPDPAAGFQGITKAARMITGPAHPSHGLGHLVGGDTGGRI